jgi:isopentenyl-diphosphate Delta-isomerase
MPRRLILVDDQDRPLGFASKKVCHTGTGRRHRAYLALIVNRKGELCLARRHPSKWLWPGVWDGTVAGHVEEGETYASAARRRVFEEVGIRPRLKRIDLFPYTARWKGNGENELCAIFVGRAEAVKADPMEIDALRWTKRPDGRLTPWLRIALERGAMEPGRAGSRRPR